MTRTKAIRAPSIQRPSMAQDMHKGRRTEIQFMNGFIAEKGKAARHPDAVAREADRSRHARRARRDAAVAREPGRLTQRRDRAEARMNHRLERMLDQSIKPSSIVRYLDEFVIGQDEAKKILAVAVYSHYRKIEQARKRRRSRSPRATCC